jgi:hypothetical protein
MYSVSHNRGKVFDRLLVAMKVAWLGVQEDRVKSLPSHVFLLDDNLPEAFLFLTQGFK